MSVRKGCRFIVAMLLVLVLACAGLAGAAWLHFQRFGDTALATPTADTVVVQRGDGFGTVLGKLRAAGISEGHDLEWRLLARRLEAAGSLKVGEYALEPGLTPATLLQRMRDGRIVQYRITLVEGWSFRQVRAALDAAQPLLHESTALDDRAIMEKLGHGGQHPEGRFLPETYLYQRGDSDLDVLGRAHAAMEQALAAAWEDRARDTPLKSADEALVLASIVEKETGRASERPQIAGVFARRLKLGMLLQTDPTVIYGIGSAYDGNIRKRDLLADTPYNTYVHPGLTPTPIAMPGRAALNAAAHPAEGDALFFVSRNDGTHVFSATYAEHNAAVDRFQRRRGAGAAADQQDDPATRDAAAAQSATREGAAATQGVPPPAGAAKR